MNILDLGSGWKIPSDVGKMQQKVIEEWSFIKSDEDKLKVALSYCYGGNWLQNTLREPFFYNPSGI